LEVLVNVTGANATAEDGARHLFSEETTTVLVFKDGAVIRLAATVAIGQLIFLTNKKSNQEVVCQVLRQRSFKAGRNYVELQFTEDRENYWGVAFPEGQKSAPEFKVADQVQAEETTAEANETPVAPHSAEDVDRLKREVEALRDQLAALEKKNVEEAAAKATADAAAAREAAVRELAMQNATKAVDAVMGHAPKHKEELASVNESSPAASHTESAKTAVEKPALLMPSSPKDSNEAAPPMVSMSLPVWKLEKSPEEQLLEEEAAQDAAAHAAEAAKAEAKPVEKPAEQPTEELLPKPELDFSQGGKGSSKKQKAKASKPKALKAGSDSNKVRTIGLVAVLVLAVGGGAWYGKWWQYLSTGKKAPAPAVVHPIAPRVSAPAPKAATPASAPSSSASGPAADAAAKPASDSNTTEDAKSENSSENESAVSEKRSAREKSSPRKETPKAQETLSAADVAGDGSSQTAKLVKSVNPVYPPDAMRSYITGDVKAEVTVLASGRVGDVKVITGPKALRQAAVDALKQYEYSPAMQSGKAVESKTSEVVKFWFNP